MLYEVFIATIILSWGGTALALVIMGIYYSDGGEMPIRVFVALAFVQMVLVIVIASWATPYPLCLLKGGI